MVLQTTLIIAAATAILNLLLAKRIGTIRNKEKILLGDGGDQMLAARMRAHANFSEYTPILLILIGAIELAGANSLILLTIGALYIAARILHAYGMDKGDINFKRVIGIIVTMLSHLILAIWAIYLVVNSMIQG